MRYRLLSALLAAGLLSGCIGCAGNTGTDTIFGTGRTDGTDYPVPRIAEAERPDTDPVLSAPAVPDTEAPVLPEPEPESGSVTISFIGDVMLASENGDDGFWSFNLFAYDTPKDYYFSEMREIFSSDDYTVANCENVFSDRELEPRGKDDAGTGFTFWYRSGTENAEIFSAGGIEVVSLANNHALDYGPEGRNDTYDALETAGCTCMAEGKSLIIEEKGLRIGILFVSMYSEYWLQPILDWLEEAKETTDYRVVYYHGGSERTHEPDAWRIRASHAMVDAGADLVLGNHPHVLQPKEVYKGKTIIHSLGNFLFGGSHTCENRTIVFRLTLDAQDGMLTGTHEKIIPCLCYGELWQPAPLEAGGTAWQRVLDFMDGKREKPF